MAAQRPRGVRTDVRCGRAALHSLFRSVPRQARQLDEKDLRNTFEAPDEKREDTDLCMPKQKRRAFYALYQPNCQCDGGATPTVSHTPSTPERPCPRISGAHPLFLVTAVTYLLDYESVLPLPMREGS